MATNYSSYSTQFQHVYYYPPPVALPPATRPPQEPVNPALLPRQRAVSAAAAVPAPIPRTTASTARAPSDPRVLPARYRRNARPSSALYVRPQYPGHAHHTSASVGSIQSISSASSHGSRLHRAYNSSISSVDTSTDSDSLTTQTSISSESAASDDERSRKLAPLAERHHSESYVKSWRQDIHADIDTKCGVPAHSCVTMHEKRESAREFRYALTDPPPPSTPKEHDEKEKEKEKEKGKEEGKQNEMQKEAQENAEYPEKEIQNMIPSRGIQRELPEPVLTKASDPQTLSVANSPSDVMPVSEGVLSDQSSTESVRKVDSRRASSSEHLDSLRSRPHVSQEELPQMLFDAEGTDAEGIDAEEVMMLPSQRRRRSYAYVNPLSLTEPENMPINDLVPGELDSRICFDSRFDPKQAYSVDESMTPCAQQPIKTDVTDDTGRLSEPAQALEQTAAGHSQGAAPQLSSTQPLADLTPQCSRGSSQAPVAVTTSGSNRPSVGRSPPRTATEAYMPRSLASTLRSPSRDSIASVNSGNEPRSSFGKLFRAFRKDKPVQTPLDDASSVRSVTSTISTVSTKSSKSLRASIPSFLSRRRRSMPSAGTDRDGRRSSTQSSDGFDFSAPTDAEVVLATEDDEAAEPVQLSAGDIFPGALRAENVDVIVSSVERTGSFGRVPSTASRRSVTRQRSVVRPVSVASHEPHTDAHRPRSCIASHASKVRLRSGALGRQCVHFAPQIVVFKTYAAEDYDRTPGRVTCDTLKEPGVVKKVREELNVVKLTMPVHPKSQKYTQFFF